MHVLRCCIIVVSLIFLACGPSGEGGQNAVDNSTSEPSTGSGDDVYATLGMAWEGILDREELDTEIGCRCFYDEDDFGSADECLDAHITSESTRADARQCLEAEAADYEAEPPDVAVDGIDCLQDAADEFDECLSAAEESHDDHCGDDFFDDAETCVDDFDASFEICDTYEGHLAGWVSDVVDAAEDAGCFDEVAL